MALRAHEEARRLRGLFEVAALPHSDAMYRLARRLTSHSEEAKDLVQDSFLRAYRAFATFRPGTNCRAWLLAITYSVFISRTRKALREPPTSSLEDHPGLLEAVPGDSAPHAVGGRWDDPEIEAAFAALPVAFRMAVLLVDIEELSYEEAAAVIDCPVGTLRSRLFRGRQALVAALGHRLPSPDGETDARKA